MLSYNGGNVGTWWASGTFCNMPLGAVQAWSTDAQEDRGGPALRHIQLEEEQSLQRGMSMMLGHKV